VVGISNTALGGCPPTKFEYRITIVFGSVGFSCGIVIDTVSGTTGWTLTSIQKAKKLRFIGDGGVTCHCCPRAPSGEVHGPVNVLFVIFNARKTNGSMAKAATLVAQAVIGG